MKKNNAKNDLWGRHFSGQAPCLRIMTKAVPRQKKSGMPHRASSEALSGMKKWDRSGNLKSPALRAYVKLKTDVRIFLLHILTIAVVAKIAIYS